MACPFGFAGSAKREGKHPGKVGLKHRQGEIATPVENHR
jgi:hypothetical protein